jgi:hypothetical protein
MKISDLTKFAPQALRALGNVSSVASHLHTAGSILGVLGGGKLPADAGDAVKGVHGAFGRGDEREFQVLYIQLDAWKKDSRELIEGFFRWHFVGDTAIERVFAWWAANSLRAFITQMGSAPIRNDADKFRIETTEVLTLEKGTKTIKTTAPVEPGSGSNNSLEFLKWMANTIRKKRVRLPKAAGIPQEYDNIPGYEALLLAFEAGNVPLMPAGQIAVLQALIGWASSPGGLAITAQRMNRKVQEVRDRPKGIVERLFT